MQNAQKMVQLLKQNIGRVVVGKEDAVELMLIALLCRGHILIEDVPGVGKTTLASALARSLDCTFKRIQFTPDITPSDITGFTMANFKTGDGKPDARLPGLGKCNKCLAAQAASALAA